MFVHVVFTLHMCCDLVQHLKALVQSGRYEKPLTAVDSIGPSSRRW